MNWYFKKQIPDFLIIYIKKKLEQIKISSLVSAIKEQNLLDLFKKLTNIVPEIEKQYSTFDVNSEYLRTKVRGQHSFQVSLIEKYLNLSNENNNEKTIVDIGDSSGTHLMYLKSLFGNYRTLSVNCDEEAVKKVKEKGLEAIHAKAEDLSKLNIDADILLSFEMLEHLSDPISFLHSISENVMCDAFIITVPYVKNSRIGLYNIRNESEKKVFAENTHYFELSPEDWTLLFKHSGWKIIYDRVYFQYPRKKHLRVLKGFWKKYDFEGFYGVILKRDDTWSSKYNDW